MPSRRMSFCQKFTPFVTKRALPVVPPAVVVTPAESWAREDPVPLRERKIVYLLAGNGLAERCILCLKAAGLQT